MSRPRILLTADAVGGVWQYATDLARALVPHGYDTILAVLGPPPSDEQRRTAGEIPGLALLETGMTLDWLAATPADVQRASAELARLAVEQRVDLVQLHTPALALASFKVPVVAMVHSCVATWWKAVREGPLPQDLQWRAALVAEGFRRADRLIAPTAAFGKMIQEAYGLPSAPHCVHNGRSLAIVRARAPHDFAFTAGRLWDPAKGAELLDQVAGRLTVPFKAAGPVIGPNGDRVRLHHLYALGRLDDQAMAEQLGARPVFVSAARYEPFGLAVLEAANAGCPLVLADIPTFRELWDGVATFVAPGDLGGFVRAVEAIIGDHQSRLALGERARERASRHSAAAMADAMVAHYSALLHRPRLVIPRVAA